MKGVSARVWVTGVGLVTSLGNDAPGTFARLVAGERGLSAIDVFDTTGQRAALGAVVRGVAVPEGDGWSRASAFALTAAREALAQAAVDPASARVGLIVGGTTAGMFENEVRVSEMLAGARPLALDDALRSHPVSSTADVLGETLGPFARVRSVASACSSGATAVVLAMSWLLEDPSLDAVVAGGTDGLCRLTLSGFNALGAIDPEPCRPFDKNRRGLNLGEGAGFLVLERAPRARARGARPIAEIAGAALGSEGHHITNPEPEGASAARVMRLALGRAGLHAADLDYVNAHGTGTPLNDRTESRAIRSVLGPESDRVFVSSSKAQLGHTLGAAGAIECVLSALVVAERTLLPTVGLLEPDPDCAVRHVPESVRMDRVRAVLSNSFGFGGMDSAVVLTEPELAPEPARAVRRVVVTGTAALTSRGVESGGALRVAPEAAPASGPVPDEALALDPAKARRLDRSARLTVCATQAALAEAGAESLPRERCGVVYGSAFSAVDESAAFVHRLFEKGPRLASPFDFPNLVPSSPVGHASIYLGLLGPTLATADLRASGESAIASACELIAAGDAEVMVAGALSVRSRLIDEVFFKLFDEGVTRAPRGECCAAVVLEAEEVARDRGARPLARVARIAVGRDARAAGLDAPAGEAVVVGAADAAVVRRWIAGTPWEGATVVPCDVATGDNEAVGAVAVGVAAQLVVAGRASSALAVGARPGRFYALDLRAV